MQLPPDDDGELDLGDTPPLLPDEGQEVLGLPDDDILGDVFGDHVADEEWLERNLADISVEDSSDYYYGALIPGLPADDCGMDSCEVCEAVVALPDDIVCLTIASRRREAPHMAGRVGLPPSEYRLLREMSASSGPSVPRSRSV